MVAADSRSERQPPVGQFRWNTSTDELLWSNGLFTLHGYRPHAVVPTIELVLQHKTSEDRPAAAAMIERARSQDHHFSYYHQIVDANGHQRTVLVVGSSQAQGSGNGVRLSVGFLADVTAHEQVITHEAIIGATRHREAINQAQGALMAIYGIGAGASFSLLSWYSQNHNIKLSLLARRIVAALESQQVESTRVSMDRLLFDEASRRSAPIDPGATGNRGSGPV